MAPEKAPAFQFYPRDFLTDGNVAAMSLQERGAYITLLCLCWTERTLPASNEKLARMLGVGISTMQKLRLSVILPCFKQDGDRITHPRLDKERAKQDEHRRRQSDKGKASAAARQPKGNRGSTTVQPEHQPDLNSASAVCSLPSSDFRQQPTAVIARGRPMPGYARLRIFRWMLDELIGTLGDYSERFDLDEWLQTVDSDGRVYPDKIWPWLKTEMVTECRRRGYPIAESGATQAGKLTTRLASAMANIRASGE